MAPHLRRTVTVLEAHPHSTTLPISNNHGKPEDGMTAPSRAPPSSTQTERQTSAAKTNAASPLRCSIRRGDPSTTRETPTSESTVTSYSSTTTICTTSSDGFATTTRPEPSSTIAGSLIHRTHVSSPYNIPDPPAWFPYMIGVLLAVMMALAVLFYCVNFPTMGSGLRTRYFAWRVRVAERRKAKTGYGYQKIDDDVDDNGESRMGTSPRLSEVADAVTTSANAPGLHNTPTLYSRRRKVGYMSLEEQAAGAGLGITLGAGQKSFDETLLRPDMDKPLPLPPRSAVQAYFTPATVHSAPMDLEAGLLKPPAHDRRMPMQPILEGAPPLPSPGLRVLEMVGGSVEYAAEKMSRFMYDSVKGDPEEGLLLPVRDCEREKKEC